MNEVNSITQGISEATEGFKQMNKALLIFAGISALGLLIAAIAIFNK